MVTPTMQDRTVVIVGATGGIGSALTRRLAAGGADLLLLARRPDRLEALAEEVGARTAAVDVLDIDALENALDDAGAFHGIVNLVGSILLKPSHLTSPEEWDRTVAANLTSAFQVVRGAAARMRSAGGSIVLMSSAAGSVGLVNHDAIAAVKAGVAGLARSAAATYAGQGIRVNAVAPGLVHTPLAQPFVATPQSRAVSEAMHPLGRIGQPEEVASLIAWLLSDDASWMTGQVLGMDGGLAAVRGRVRA
jgi:NAD(P)-dependent dehydrogenase (short-subunit alcohol dehydrogenase family)